MNTANDLPKWLFLILLFITACTNETDKNKMDDLKSEIIKIEKDFADLAKKEGIAKAFFTYAAEDAVLNRNNTLIKGKEAIKVYFEKQTLTDVNLEWKADFADVAISGDMAYTYGNYVFSAIDTNGVNIKSEGIFHTVWKKQADGSWRFVWD